MTMNAKPLTLGLAFAALLAACGADPQPSGNTPAEISQTDPAPVPVGHAASTDEATFTVTAVTTPKQIGPQGVGGKAAAGETYVVVDYTIKNTGGSTLPFMEWPKFSLVSPSGQTIASDDMAGAMSASTMEDPSGMASDLNPGVSAKARTAWKIDASTFDKKTWKLVLASDPQLTFALQ